MVYVVAISYKVKKCSLWQGCILFMHTGVQMKYVSKLTDARRTSREEGSSLLDCAAPCRGNMPLKRRMGRAASSGEGHSLT